MIRASEQLLRNLYGFLRINKNKNAKISRKNKRKLVEMNSHLHYLSLCG